MILEKWQKLKAEKQNLKKKLLLDCWWQTVWVGGSLTAVDRLHSFPIGEYKY